MKSLDVIGDSFSDEEHLKQSNTQTRKDENKTYLELLREETWEINNYSWHGIGATQAIERVNNINIRSDYLLFILPQIKRIKFKNYTDDNVTLMYVKYKNNNLPVEFMTDYNAVYSTTLLEMYDTLCLTYVFNFCQNYKKILIWPVTKNQFIGLNYTPRNCYIVNKHLNQISEDEYIKYTKKELRIVDLRNNHMSKNNHIIMAEQLKSYFIYNSSPDVTAFETKIYNTESAEDFIYE